MQPVTISRRRLLGTAGAAGLAAGGARWLPTAPERRRRARRGPPRATRRCPPPADSGIEHVVVVMMENRSFDHFLGWLPGRRRQAGRPDATSTAYGVPHATHHLDGLRTAAGTPTPTTPTRAAGSSSTAAGCDGWLRSGENDLLPIGYYTAGRPRVPRAGRAATGRRATATSPR